jgi:NRPS condensation-like uncharacterized protein
MTVYAWGAVFDGETVTWTDTSHETITFSGGTVLENPADALTNDVQVVVIGVEEYDFGVNRDLWAALWDWAVATADNALMIANTVESDRIEADLSGFVIE